MGFNLNFSTCVCEFSLAIVIFVHPQNKKGHGLRVALIERSKNA